MAKNLPAMQETWAWSLGREDPLEQEMATHSSILACRIPWTEEPGELQSTGPQRITHDWVTNTYSQSFPTIITINLRIFYPLTSKKPRQSFSISAPHPTYPPPTLGNHWSIASMDLPILGISYKENHITCGPLHPFFFFFFFVFFYKGKWKVKSLSRVRLFATAWPAGHQAPPSMGFSRQGHWSGLPFPPPPCILSLSITLSRFTQGVVCVGTSVLFIAEYYSTASCVSSTLRWVPHGIQSPVEGHLHLFTSCPASPLWVHSIHLPCSSLGGIWVVSNFLLLRIVESWVETFRVWKSIFCLRTGRGGGWC